MSSTRDRPTLLRPFLSLIPKYLAYALTAAVTSLLPLLLWRWNPGFIGNTYGEAYEPFELFGFWAAAAILGSTIWALRREETLTWPRILPILIPAGLLFHFLNLITEYSFPAWDYECYQLAASALLAGTNPYTGCYLYPPLLAEILGIAYRGVLSLTFLSEREPAQSWSIVFYLFQCLQFFAIALAYPLLYRFARRLGFRKLTAVFLVAVLLLINTPLLRTIRHTQVNLIVLDLFLIGLLVADRLSLVSGFSIAAGVHLKLYPAVLFVPWLLARRWRAIFWGLVGLGLLIIANAAWGQNWALWDQFLAASQSFPPGNQFRDNSLHSLVFNGLAFLAAPLGISGSMVRTIVSIVVIALSIILSGWIGLRIFRRQRSLAEGAISAELLYFSQAMDVLALGLLLAPRIWEHHYVLAVPVVLWGTAVAGEKRPWLVGTAALLMLSLPTFDIFPLSYHRLAGLLLMLCLTSDKSRPDDVGPALF